MTDQAKPIGQINQDRKQRLDVAYCEAVYRLKRTAFEQALANALAGFDDRAFTVLLERMEGFVAEYEDLQ